jgi:hypothetical protein
VEARLLLRSAVALALLACATNASAADDATNACLAASEDAQSLRDKGRLLDARAKLIECGRATCPAVVRTDCAKWLDELTPRLPSIVVRVVDENGHDVVDARVTIDGVATANAADGRAIDLDPGPHKLRAEATGYEGVEQTVVAREGERTRAVTLAFAKRLSREDRRSDQPAPTSPVPTISWVLGGVGVAGGFSFAVLASMAKSEVDDMRMRCAPTCPESEVSSARTELAVANISLAVGVLALGTALAFVRW